MRAWNLIILLFFIGPGVSATLVGRDYPFYIFNDEGVIRYCMQPVDYLSTSTMCFFKIDGVYTEKECKILKIDDGYIDCKGDDL